MDGQQYLDQISPATNKNSKLSKLLSNTAGKIIVLGVGAIIAFVVILIIGSSLSGSKKDLKYQIFSLGADIDTVSQIAEDHKADIKSSALRKSTSSLVLSLNNLSEKLGTFAINAYPEEDPSTGEVNAYIATIGDDLRAAATGYNFDTAYARKIAIAIDDINTEVYDIYISTKNGELQEILAEIQESILTFYDQFNNYSE